MLLYLSGLSIYVGKTHVKLAEVKQRWICFRNCEVQRWKVESGMAGFSGSDDVKEAAFLLSAHLCFLSLWLHSVIAQTGSFHSHGRCLLTDPRRPGCNSEPPLRKRTYLFKCPSINLMKGPWLALLRPCSHLCSNQSQPWLARPIAWNGRWGVEEQMGLCKLGKLEREMYWLTKNN